MIELFVHGTPRTSGSKKGFPNPKTGGVIIVPAGKYQKGWQDRVAWAAMQAGFNGKMLLEGPLTVELVFSYKRNPKDFRVDGKTLLKDKNKEKITRPDLDKLVRAVLDPLTKLVWHDDAQIVLIVALKQYAEQGEPEGVHISISKFGEEGGESMTD